MKLCRGCDKVKFLADFGTRNVGKRLHPQSYCKKCRRKASQKRDDLHPEVRQERNQGYYWKKDREKRFIKKFGINLEQHAQLVKQQSNKCKICQKTFINSFSTHIDHNHATGQIRGILCSTCNQGLGLFKENIATLQAAIDYLLTNASEVCSNDYIT